MTPIMNTERFCLVQFFFLFIAQDVSSGCTAIVSNPQFSVQYKNLEVYLKLMRLQQSELIISNLV